METLVSKVARSWQCSIGGCHRGPARPVDLLIRYGCFEFWLGVMTALNGDLDDLALWPKMESQLVANVEPR